MADTSMSKAGIAVGSNLILHCALTSTQQSSTRVSSSATTVDDRRPTDLKKPCRFGRTFTKSSLFTACVPCGPAKTNDSPYCAAMAAGSAPPMFSSYWSKNALTRSLPRCMAGSFHLPAFQWHKCITPGVVDAIRDLVISAHLLCDSGKTSGHQTHLLDRTHWMCMGDSENRPMAARQTGRKRKERG